MKIRTGFVSNSSSSSFVVRGIKIDAKLLAEKLNISLDEDENELYYALESGISKMKDFEIHSTGNYFGNKNYESVVIGISAGDLEDGELTEFPDTSEIDKKVLKELEKFGIEVKDGLKLYIQYISNDNF